MSYFRNWYYSYLRKVPAQEQFEAALARLGRPYRVQYPFPRFSCIADFLLLPDLVIEIDGTSHNDEAQIAKDHAHTLALEKAGYAVVRVSNAEVFDSPERAVNLALGRVSTRLTIPELEALVLAHPVPISKRRRRLAKPLTKGHLANSLGRKKV